MTHPEMLERLHERADGELSPAALAEVEAHLAGCEACRAEAEAIAALKDEAAALPREVQPQRDLWAGIAARIEETRVVEVDFARPRPAAAARRSVRALWASWPALAAAAVLLVIASSTTTMLLLRRPAAAPLATLPAEVVGTAPAATALAAFRPAEVEYQRSIEALEVALEAGRGRLAPETVAVVEANLRIIDRAIAESRAALAADPTNGELVQMLNGVYQRKVEVLEQTVLAQARS